MSKDFSEKKMKKAAGALVKMAVAEMEKKMATMKPKEKVSSVSKLEKKVKTMTGKERTRRFVKALLSNDKIKLKVLSEGVSADGGYLVPQVWYRTIVEELRDISDIRSRATVIDPCPQTLKISKLENKPVPFWTGELVVKDTSTAQFEQISLTPYTLAVIVLLSKQLAEDAEVGGSIVDYVQRKIIEGINEEEEKAFAVGSGTGRPTGIDTYNATIPRIVPCPAAALTTADPLISAYYKLGQRYLRNAVWLMNSITLTKVMQLKDSQNRNIFVPDPTGATPGTILGRPVVRNDSLNATRIWLIDLKGYMIGVRGGISISQSEEAYVTAVGSLWERNLIGIRVEERIDGELADYHSAVVITNIN